MPQVLGGSQPGLTIADIIQVVCDETGWNPDSARIKNRIIRAVNSTLLEIQLEDPSMKRTVVYDADFTLISGQADYDVTLSVENGGFGWDNLHDILHLYIPSLADRPLEAIDLSQWRQRAPSISASGPVSGFVRIDQQRIRVVPTPEAAYSGKGDYTQNIPKITSMEQKIDWPRSWDAVLTEGVLFRAMRQQFSDQPAVWGTQLRLYRAMLDNKESMEKANTVRPGQVVLTRYYRGKRYISRNRSADLRNL